MAVAILVVALAVVSNLINPGAPEASSTSSDLSSGSDADPGSPGGSGRCQAASSSVLNSIAAGLTVTGGGSLRDGKIVRSQDFEKVWFVAAEIDGSGIEGRGDIGIWATNSTSGSGVILAVDGYAHEFSDWAFGPDTDFDVTQFDDGAREARTCQQAR